jgi:hypothetical protein
MLVFDAVVRALDSIEAARPDRLSGDASPV